MYRSLHYMDPNLHSPNQTHMEHLVFDHKMIRYKNIVRLGKPNNHQYNKTDYSCRNYHILKI